MTLLSLFHSQERLARTHSYSEKIKFLKQKIIFFDKKLMFCKEMSILFHFCQTLNFGHLVWVLGVAFELYDIGGSKRIVGSPPSSNDVVIGPLLSLGGRKISLSSAVASWNNYLHFKVVITSTYPRR